MSKLIEIHRRYAADSKGATSSENTSIALAPPTLPASKMPEEPIASAECH